MWEVLVVANNCSDDTDAVVDSFGAGSNVRLRMVSEPRQGVGHARLRAFSSSESEFLAYIDDDCTADPRWVAAAYQALSSNPRAGVAGGRVTLDWAVQPDDALSSVPQAYAGVELGNTALNLTSHHMPRVVGANLVFRRSALEQSGWAQDRLLFGRTGRRATAGEDTEMVLFVRRAGWEVWHHPSLAVAHHINDDRLTKRYATHIFYGFGRTSPTKRSWS